MPLPPESQIVDHIEALFAYEGPLADSLQAFKFSGQVELAGPLGELLASSQALQANPPWDLVIPVPLHTWRELYRGYNQVILLAQWMLRHVRKRNPHRHHLPVLAKGLLKRSKATAAQSSLHVNQRKMNVQGAFHLSKDAHAAIEGRRILVLDDVTTTGSTLLACMDTLRKAGAAELAGLALLRTLA